MNIIKRGNVEFLEVNNIGGAEKVNLNPYYLNIKNIRYIRIYKDKNIDNACAIFIGNKMFIIRDEFDLCNKKPGDDLFIGSVCFSCCEGTPTDTKNDLKPHKSQPTIYFVNHEHTLYIRKYIKLETVNQDSSYSTKTIAQKTGGSATNDDKKDSKIDIFAIVTTDERLIPIEGF